MEFFFHMVTMYMPYIKHRSIEQIFNYTLLINHRVGHINNLSFTFIESTLN